jgi:hypothetical protein
MIFEIGKFYKHTTGLQFSILAEITTTMRGNGLVAETNNANEEITTVGKSEAAAENFTEISEDEWMKNFN